MDDHHLAWFALSELNLTFKQGYNLAQLYGHGPAILEQQLTAQLAAILNPTQRQQLARLTSKPLHISLAKQLQWLERNNAFMLLYDDADYPDALKSIHHPPAF